MKLAEKILLNMEESNVSVSHYFDVSSSLHALSEIVGVIGDEKLAKELKSNSDRLEKMSKRAYVSNKEFSQVMREIDLRGTFKKLQKVIGDYVKSGKTMRYGRKKVNLEDAMINFVKVAQKAKKEE